MLGSILPHHLPLVTGEAFLIVLHGLNEQAEMLAEMGYEAFENSFHIQRCKGPWSIAWKQTCDALSAEGTKWEATTRVAVFNEEACPAPSEMEPYFRPVPDIHDIANSLWLGRALLENRVLCYLQPIMDREGAVFAHEAFARAQLEDGSVANGYDIITASRHLNIEYRLDRLLHRKAIEALVQSGQEGRLFINFLPGFIHRPEVYLNGLCEELRDSGLSTDRIILDLMQSETQKNIEHLKTITRFCHEKGLAVSLDDIGLTDHSEKLLQIIRPKYVKLDQRLQPALMADRLVKLVTMAHILGIKVIGEGVESEETWNDLKAMGVDYFQGYYLGPPAPIAFPTRFASA